MIKSRWRLTYKGLTLLDFGDYMTDSPSMPLSGAIQESRFVGARWGKVTGRGNRFRSFSWSRELVFSTIAERMGYQVHLSGSYPIGETGSLIVEIEGGSTHSISDFSISLCDPLEDVLNPSNLILNFEGTGGENIITNRAGLGGLGWENIDSNWEDISTKWEDKITA